MTIRRITALAVLLACASAVLLSAASAGVEGDEAVRLVSRQLQPGDGDRVVAADPALSWAAEA